MHSSGAAKPFKSAPRAFTDLSLILGHLYVFALPLEIRLLEIHHPVLPRKRSYEHE